MAGFLSSHKIGISTLVSKLFFTYGVLFLLVMSFDCYSQQFSGSDTSLMKKHNTYANAYSALYFAEVGLSMMESGVDMGFIRLCKLSCDNGMQPLFKASVAGYKENYSTEVVIELSPDLWYSLSVLPSADSVEMALLKVNKGFVSLIELGTFKKRQFPSKNQEFLEIAHTPGINTFFMSGGLSLHGFRIEELGCNIYIPPYSFENKPYIVEK